MTFSACVRMARKRPAKPVMRVQVSSGSLWYNKSEVRQMDPLSILLWILIGLVLIFAIVFLAKRI
jgi:hypothetical protein